MYDGVCIAPICVEGGEETCGDGEWLNSAAQSADWGLKSAMCID